MASFAQHVNVAVVATGLCVVPLYSAGLVDISQAMVLLFFGIIGGVLPDIDLQHSKPVKIASSVLSIFIPLVAILTLLESLSIIRMLVTWFLAAAVLHFLIFDVLVRFTVHRGVIHSVPMGIVFGQLLSIGFFYFLGYSELFSLLCGCFLFLGFMVHLILDELVSLNAFGMTFKRSLGTALKLYEKKNLIGTALLYISIVVLFLSYPFNMDYFTDIIRSYERVHL